MNNKTTNNLFSQTTLYDISENPNGELGKLQAAKVLAGTPKKRRGNMGVNWAAIFWLMLLIATVGGLIYRAGDAFLVQDFINKVVAGGEVAVRLGKNMIANLMDGDLSIMPIVPMLIEQLAFILSGVILLSILGLLWSIIARSNKYKNGCRLLEETIITLRGELLRLVADIQSATVELEQTTEEKEAFLATLSENHAVQSQETMRPLKRLGENTQQISALVNTMREVAEQTNISLLNVSIRIATAGESSHELATIAEEVRRLAEVSNRVANEINEHIKNMQQDADSVIASIESTTASTTMAGGENEAVGQDSPRIVDQFEVALALEQTKSVTQKLKQMVAEFKLSAD